MMPKAALTVLSLMDSLKRNIDIAARHHHVSVFSVSCIYHSISVLLRIHYSWLGLPQFAFALIHYYPATE
jgi:hypothetical protein